MNTLEIVAAAYASTCRCSARLRRTAHPDRRPAASATPNACHGRSLDVEPECSRYRPSHAIATCRYVSAGTPSTSNHARSSAPGRAATSCQSTKSRLVARGAEHEVRRSRVAVTQRRRQRGGGEHQRRQSARHHLGDNDVVIGEHIAVAIDEPREPFFEVGLPPCGFGGATRHSQTAGRAPSRPPHSPCIATNASMTTSTRASREPCGERASDRGSEIFEHQSSSDAKKHRGVRTGTAHELPVEMRFRSYIPRSACAP